MTRKGSRARQKERNDNEIEKLRQELSDGINRFSRDVAEGKYAAFS
jgi:hypothetical protein